MEWMEGWGLCAMGVLGEEEPPAIARPIFGLVLESSKV
jgi:hypothetical protein